MTYLAQTQAPSNWTLSSLASPAAPSNFPFLPIFVGIHVAIYLFEEYLRYRQRGSKSSSANPTQQRWLFMVNFSTIRELINMLPFLVIFCSGVFPRIWDLTDRSWLRSDATRGAAFIVGWLLASVAFSLPFQAYETYAICPEGKEKPALLGFFAERGIAFVATSAICVVTVMIGVQLISSGGPHLWLYAWLAVSAIILAGYLLLPLIHAKMCCEFYGLENAELKHQIENLAQNQNFPLGDIRTLHEPGQGCGVYFYGCGSKRLVIYQEGRIQDKLDDSEIGKIVATVAHALGHWNHSHNQQTLCFELLHVFVLFLLFGIANGGKDIIARSFGFAQPEESSFVSAMLFWLVYSPVEVLIWVAKRLMLRRFETEADQFVVGLGRGNGLRGALSEQMQKSGKDPDPDWMYSAYHYSHPALAERLRMLPGHPHAAEQEQEEVKVPLLSK